jgi:hypothetical protein
MATTVAPAAAAAGTKRRREPEMKPVPAPAVAVDAELMEIRPESESVSVVAPQSAGRHRTVQQEAKPAELAAIKPVSQSTTSSAKHTIPVQPARLAKQASSIASGQPANASVRTNDQLSQQRPDAHAASAEEPQSQPQFEKPAAPSKPAPPCLPKTLKPGVWYTKPKRGGEEEASADSAALQPPGGEPVYRPAKVVRVPLNYRLAAAATAAAEPTPAAALQREGPPSAAALSSNPVRTPEGEVVKRRSGIDQPIAPEYWDPPIDDSLLQVRECKCW